MPKRLADSNLALEESHGIGVVLKSMFDDLLEEH